MASYEIGKLVWQITGDTSGIDKSIDLTNTKVKTFGSNFSGVLSKIGAAFGIYKIAETILNIGTASLKASAQMETQRVAFTTMLGSAAKAQALIKEVSDFAASTPFQLPEIVDASKKLISFGESSITVVDTLRRLGDVASGLSIPLGELTEIYGKARVQGTLYAEDLNQLAGRGIPIFTELAKVMNVNSSEVKKLGSEGKITFSSLEQVFKNLTSAGGQFAGLMDAQSKTLAGKWSNFNDALGRSAVIIGDEMAPTAGDLLSLFTNIINKFNEFNKASDFGEAESLGVFSRTLKNANADLDGTWDNLNRIFALMGEEQDVALRNEILAIEATSSSVSEQFDQILKKHGDVNGAAGIYSQYLSGQVKLTEQQVKKLEKILDLSKDIPLQWNIGAGAFIKFSKQFEKINDDNTKSNKQWASERRRVYEETADFINQNTKSETELLKMELDERLENLEKYRRKGEDISKQKADLEIIYAEKVKQAEQKNLSDRINNFNGYVQQIGGALTGLLSAFQAYSDAVLQNKIDRLDAELEAELEAAGVSEETTVEQAQKEYDLAVATGDALTIEDKRKALVKAQIEEKYQKKKAELEYKAAYSGWKFQMAIAAAQIPLAIMNAVASGAQAPWFLQPGFMIAMGSIAGVTAGAQLAAVAASEPEKPKFASGGIIPGSAQGTALIAGENNRTEVIMNPDQMANTLMAIGNGAQSTGSAYAQLPPISDRALFNLIFEASQNGDLFIAQRAVTSK